MERTFDCREGPQSFKRHAGSNKVLGTDADELRDGDVGRFLPPRLCSGQNIADFAGDSFAGVRPGGDPPMQVPVSADGIDRISKHPCPIQGYRVEFTLGRVIGTDGGDVLARMQPLAADEGLAGLRRSNQYIAPTDDLLDVVTDRN
jgi:hypothetical protein